MLSTTCGSYSAATYSAATYSAATYSAAIMYGVDVDACLLP